MGKPNRKESEIAQVRFLAEQMKQARKDGDTERASKLQLTIHTVNVQLQRNSQLTANYARKRKTIPQRSIRQS